MDACMRWPIFGSFAKSVKKPSRDDNNRIPCPILYHDAECFRETQSLPKRFLAGPSQSMFSINAWAVRILKVVVSHAIT